MAILTLPAARRRRAWTGASLLVLVLGAAAALRFPALDDLSLWYDEGWSLYVAPLAPAEALRALVREVDPHPPGYYLLLIGWSRLFGVSATALRALSALLGVLGVGAMALLGRELARDTTVSPRAAALLSAALLALAPAHILYSREGRMYTLLGLSLTLLAALTYRYARARHRWRPCHWAALVAAEALALYTHFFALFVVGSLGLWLLVVLLHEIRGDPGRDGRLLWRWLAAQAVVFALYLPWLPVILERAAGHTTGSSYVPPPARFLAETWSFLLSGQTDLLTGNPTYATLAAAALVALVVAGVALAWSRRTEDRALRDPLAFLVLQCLLPLAGVYALTLLRPGYHPRYLLMILYPLLAVLALQALALLRGPGTVRRVAGGLLLVLWLSAMAVGGRLALNTLPWRDDPRALIGYLSDAMPPGSGVVAAYRGWELRPYLAEAGLAGAFPEMTRPSEELEPEIAAWLAGRPRVAYVRWGQSDTDRAGLIPYLLARGGMLVAEQAFPGYTVSVYSLESDPAPVVVGEAGVRFGSLALQAARLGDQSAAGGALAVALQWRLEAPVSEDLKVSLTLVDAAGHALVQNDRTLRDALGRGTANWAAGDVHWGYVTLRLGLGLPPGAYRVEARVYHEGDLGGLDLLDARGAPLGKAHTLGTVTTRPASYPRPAGDAAPILAERLGLTPLPVPADLATGLALTAVRLERSRLSTGERLGVLLAWQRTSAEPLPDVAPALHLVRGGTVLATWQASSALAQYPTSAWAQDEPVLDWRDVTIPAGLPAGTAELHVALPGAAPISLGVLEIDALARTFDRPAIPQPLAGGAGGPIGGLADLAGYGLESETLAASDDLVVTLFWRALDAAEGERVAFVHLVSANGRLIAQHDGVPVDGTRPASGWLPGEYLTDRHTLNWLDSDYRGPAALFVGIYDPGTGVRLTSTGGADHLVLPAEITVTP